VHRSFAPLVDLPRRRAAARLHALARLSTFVPATFATLAFLVAACVSNGVRTPPATRANVMLPRDDAPYHWPAAELRQLTVWVQPWSDAAGWTPQHLTLVDSALAAWSVDGSVAFRHVSRSQDADIRIYWTATLPARHPGVTTLTPNRRGALERANIWVNVTAAARQTATSDEVLYGIIAHELGHALGLSHATDDTQLMYPVLYRLAVSAEDLDALRAVAGRKAVATRKAVETTVEGVSTAGGGH
jgi:hypothetical protein